MNTTELEKALIKLIDERIDERFKKIVVIFENFYGKPIEDLKKEIKEIKIS